MLLPDVWLDLCKIGVEPTAECMRTILSKRTSLTFGVQPVDDEAGEFEEVMFYPKLATHGPGERFHGVIVAMNGDVWAVEAIYHRQNNEEQSTLHVLYKHPEGSAMLVWNES